MTAIAPPLRRGACPALSAPMPTGDGLLVRLGASGAPIGLDQASALCAAARRHGNGIIEVTARGSIQIRGLSSASARAFAEAVTALGIDAGGRVPILTDPLAGLAPAPAMDAREIADALRQRLAPASFAARLAPKVSVVIDGGSKLHLDAVAADLRLRAHGTGWHVSVGGDAGDAVSLGSVAPADAVETALQLLKQIARHGPQARARDLVRRGGLQAFTSAIAQFLNDAPEPAARPAADPIGTHSVRDGRVALGIGLAFGHTNAEALGELIDVAARAGAHGLRTAAGRAIIIVGIASEASRSLAAPAENAGFITRRDEPRRHLVACPGAPICAAADIPARALAPSLCAAAAPLLDGSLTIHVSGCPKGCAHPGPCALTIVGSKHGCDLVIDGNARGTPSAAVAPEELSAALKRVAADVAQARRPGEPAASTLTRLSAAHVAHLFGAMSDG